MNLFSILATLRGFLLKYIGIRLGAPIGDTERSERFDSYIRSDLAPAMHIQVSETERVSKGTNPIVRKIIDSSGGAHIARCFARRIAGKEKSREHAHVSRFLDQAGVAVPQQEHYDESCRTLGRYGFEVVVEEYVAGRHLSIEDFRSPDQTMLKNLVELMVRIHAQTSSYTGVPWRRRHEKMDFVQKFYVERERRALAAIEESDLAAEDPSSLDTVRSHMETHRRGLRLAPPYSLVHGDIQNRNLVVRSEPRGTSEPEIVLIDFGTVHYGLWPWDIVGFHNGCAGRDIDLTRSFVRLYCEQKPEIDIETLRQAWDYLHPFYHIEKCGAALRKYRRTREGRRSASDPESLQQRAVEQWRLTVESVRSGASPL